MLGGTGVALARLELFLPTNEPSSPGPVTHSIPSTCNETSDVVLLGVLKFTCGIEFSKLTVRQSPTFALNTIGRGLLSVRSCVPFWATVSRLRAKIIPPGIAAPNRFIMIGCGIATTSAVIIRLHCAGVGAGTGAATG